MGGIAFNVPRFLGKELENIEQAIASGHVAGNGHFTDLCRSSLRTLTGAAKADLVHSCTGALEMAVILCDSKPGDEFILPSYTFVSTANAVVLRGCVPVFVDVDPDTMNIDPRAVAEAVTPRTRGILAVHYAGVPAEMDALSAIAREHDLMLIEDAAQALGSSYRGRPCGGLGDIAAFSFHETKNLTSGEGGALTLTRPDLFERADVIRDKGTNRSLFLEGAVDKYTWVDVGSSFVPSEITAAMLLAQLQMAEVINADRLATAARYHAAFADLEQAGRIRLPVCPEHSQANGHLFYLLMRDETDRRAFIGHMRARKIETPFHYVPLHSAPAGRRFGRVSGSMNVTDRNAARLVRLPLFFNMTDEVDIVVEAARDYLEKVAP